MKRILRTLMLLLASLIALSPAAAQEDAGPYRLGTGDEQVTAVAVTRLTAGDRYDGTIAAALLEHWFNALRGLGRHCIGGDCWGLLGLRRRDARVDHALRLVGILEAGRLQQLVGHRHGGGHGNQQLRGFCAQVQRLQA